MEHSGVGLVRSPEVPASTLRNAPGTGYNCVMKKWLVVSMLACSAAVPLVVHAQADEIQVYDGGLAEPGQFNLTIHDNYIAEGARVAADPGGIVPNHSFNGVLEWAYGVNRWIEAGLYAPLYSHSEGQGFTFNGVKLRLLMAVPDADKRRFFYGVNFEASYNRPQWDASRYSQEARFIAGWHLGRWDIVLNPIVDISDSEGEVTFVPASRIAYHIDDRWQLALEEYDDFGELGSSGRLADQAHQGFAVVDYAGKSWEVEAGVGVGWTSAADRLTFKLILSHDL